MSLVLTSIAENKKCWKTISNEGVPRNVTLVEGDQIISENKDVAEAFNSFFGNIVATLKLNIRTITRLILTFWKILLML